MRTGEWRGYEKECFTIMPNTLLYNMNISRVYQYSNKNISKSIYNISKCITIFYVCQYWWCFHSRTLCTCSHVKYGMKKWTLLFPVLISIKVNELSSRVPETFSLQFDQWFLKLLCSWVGRYHFLIFSPELALQKQTNKQTKIPMAYTERKHTANTCCPVWGRRPPSLLAPP